MKLLSKNLLCKSSLILLYFVYVLTLSPVLKVLALSEICLLRLGGTSTTYILGVRKKNLIKATKKFLTGGRPTEYTVFFLLLSQAHLALQSDYLCISH